MDTYLVARAVAEIGECLRVQDHLLATAESCTGGLIASTLTDTPGSSEWFAGSVVAYANQVKTKLLGVPETTLEQYGAVSEPVVIAMAQGALKALDADVSVAVSGIAGPGGGTPDKPVGTVWIAWAWPGGNRARQYNFQGTRDQIKGQTVMAAVNGLLGVTK
ncbi:MAG: CinA family protein [Pseudodesulfovibrio sp.]|jgi:nicotinamide-nucleotide amidase|uniref:Damage-inducible protein CinA n=1 Tax=Pseudodesulfovibrio indicus TaxID=1716143 RepID=A0A126QLA9_9BACT|nr:CinA family protein [Pseudodesulfovibrio indicus]AMK10458.1 damage-inducible protein CinA [Pseudodesulfovibrio indicus]TDT89145.1 nicotinamide-nucleotide amidase [Pseudodesulfovibrio indicus]